jgi:hypothetical protein
MSTSRLNRIGHYIENIDPFGLLLTVHDTQNYDALVQDEIWLDMANLQYAAGTAAKASVTNSFILNHFRGKPVAATEVVWEGTTKLTADEVRRGGWGVLMAGSFFLYGEFDLDGPGVGPYGAGGAHPYIKIMLDFLHGKPYWEMTPHNELVNSGNFSLAEPGVEYIVYAENGGPVTLDLQNADGTFQVQWLNPRTGVITPAGTVVGGGKPSFSNPVEDQNDWVLYLHKTNDTQFDYHIFLPITIHKYY